MASRIQEEVQLLGIDRFLLRDEVRSYNFTFIFISLVIFFSFISISHVLLQIYTGSSVYQL